MPFELYVWLFSHDFSKHFSYKIWAKIEPSLNDFSLFSYTTDTGKKKYVGAPLPVILYDGGLKVFSSSKFNHGKTLAQVNGNHYKLYHNKIYKTDAEGTINYDD